MGKSLSGVMNTNNKHTEDYSWTNWQKCNGGCDFDGFGPIGDKIEALCKRKLRDGVLMDNLAGREAEIRQNAMIMLLGGFLDGNRRFVAAAGENDPDAIEINLRRVVALAIRYNIIRMAHSVTVASSRHTQFRECHGGVCQHPAEMREEELPYATRLRMALMGLKLAEAMSKISPKNAKTAVTILTGQLTVDELARKRGVDRSAIYQQLIRVCSVLPQIMEMIEVPMA